MKNYSILRVLLVLSVLFVGVQFSGCNKDDDTGLVPIASFTYTATNNQNAPTTVSFSNEIQIDVEYNWDFGNGETFFGRDPIVTFTEEGTYTVQLTVTGEGGMAQVSQDIVVGPLTITNELLTGVWSIVREEITMLGSSTPIIKERPMNWDILSYAEGGSYDRISMTWLEREDGTYSIDGDVITQTPTAGSDFTPIDILVTYMDDEEIVAEVDMEEGHMVVTLRKNGSEYFSQGPLPRPSIGDFAGNKWSILEETTKIFAYSQTDDEYTDLVSTGVVANIPYNFSTIDVFIAGGATANSLRIDNWEEGVYEYMGFSQLKPSTTYWAVDSEGRDIIILITNNLDDINIETTSVGFIEEEGEEVKFEITSKLKRSDGSEATITEAELTGQWEVTAKTETKDGVDVDPIDSYTPPVGFVLGFNSDGSAVLGDPTPGNWFVLDDSNFVVVSPEGDETLVHVTGFDSASAELTVFGKWIEGGFVFEMTLSLEKQL